MPHLFAYTGRQSADPDCNHVGLFDEWESGTIDSWKDAINILADISSKNPDRRFVWRGVNDATFGLYSSLFRRIAEDSSPDTKFCPSEEHLQEAERRILDMARTSWRLDMAALPLFAHLQHYGAPTRLIDVTTSAYIGLFFACLGRERHHGRIFGFGADTRDLTLSNDRGNWHISPNIPWESDTEFGNTWRSEPPLIYYPPRFPDNDRPWAQHSAFLLGGTPSIDGGSGSLIRYRDQTRVPVRQIMQTTSICVKMVGEPHSKKIKNSNPFPTFTYRISPDGKKDILKHLERDLDISASRIYPDMAGRAQSIADDPHIFDDVFDQTWLTTPTDPTN